MPFFARSPPARSPAHPQAVQKFVQQIQASQRPSAKEARLAEPSRKDRKKAEEEAQREMDALFVLSIKQPKLAPGVDPKSVLCEHFRHGKCVKGFKCKYSHDLNVERKTAKIDLFTDRRDGGDEDGPGTMEEWTQEQLEKAVADKHGKQNENRPTQIICKFFLEAVEKKLYGWFWQCPNGSTCQYRHALPAGYLLKSQIKELLDAEAAALPSIEETIEEERAKVDAKTKINEEIFRRWRDGKTQAKKEAALKAEEERRRKGILTGREIFVQEGFQAVDDASASDSAALSREVDDEVEASRVRAEAERLEQAARAGGPSQQDGTFAGGSVDDGPTVGERWKNQEEGAGAGAAEDDSDDDDLLDELEANLDKVTVS